METSIGIIETKGYAALISSINKVLEDTTIELIKVEKIGGGIVSAFFTGDVERLKAAFEKGIREARQIGEIVAAQIIAAPSKQINHLVIGTEKLPENSQIQKEIAIPKMLALEKKKVSKIKRPPFDALKVKSAKKIDGDEKLNKTSDMASTIQRLRREALSSVDFVHDSESVTLTPEGKNVPQVNLSKVENLNVHELRKLARGTKDFPIQGREISRANRKELVSYFKEIS
jgi:microcompartment protein CcmL/EutN